MMNNTMSYKDFSAKIEYSAEDGCFIGRVLGISDGVEFRGKSLEELEAQFKIVLDEYLAECAKEGVEPGKSYSGKFALRLPVEMHKALHMRSEAMGISINELIVAGIGRFLKHGGRPGHGRGDLLEDLPFSYGAMQISDQAVEHGHGPHDHSSHGPRGCGHDHDDHDHDDHGPRGGKGKGKGHGHGQSGRGRGRGME